MSQSIKKEETPVILPFTKTLDNWKVVVLPGGIRPVRKNAAAGFDLATRAIVSLEQDERRPEMRKTLFDFVNIRGCDPKIRKNVHKVGREWIYSLRPGKYVRLGIGILLEIPEDLDAYVHRRGSTSNKLIDLIDVNKKRQKKLKAFMEEFGVLVIQNSEIPIDSDYRAEPSINLYNGGKKPILIRRHHCYAQLVLRPIHIKEPEVSEYELCHSVNELSATERGYGQNGSTGKSVYGI